MNTPYMLSLVIPVYNEETYVFQLLEKLTQVSYGSAIDSRELVIINDGSKDRSEAEIKRFMETYPAVSVQYHAQENTGKWGAVKKGFSLAQWDIIVIQDADLEYDPCDLAEWISLIKEKWYHVAYWSRIRWFTRHGFTYSTLPFLVWGLVVSGLTSVFTGRLITDEPTCYKMFHKACKPYLVFPKENWFEREPAVTVMLLRSWFRYKERPIRYYPRQATGGKKIKLKDGFKALTTLWKRRIKKLPRLV